MNFRRPAVWGLQAVLLACCSSAAVAQLPAASQAPAASQETVSAKLEAPDSVKPMAAVAVGSLDCSKGDAAREVSSVTLPTVTLRRGLRIWRDVELVQGAVSVKFDVYRPDDDRNLPPVLMIHGGAWSMGDKRSLEMHARELAQEGYVAVSTNYRLAPKHQFPAQLCDCDLVLQWLLSDSAPFAVSTERYALWGYSAGAQLAALVACRQTQGGRPPVCCVVGGIPADFQWLPSGSDMLAHVFGGTREAKPDVYQQASPVDHITKDLCPFFLYHGTRDFIVPCEVSHRMHAKLAAANVESELFEVAGKEHFLAFVDSDARRRAIAFVEEKFSAVQKAN